MGYDVPPRLILTQDTARAHVSPRSKNSKRLLLFVGRPKWDVTPWISPSCPIGGPWTSRYGWTANGVRVLHSAFTLSDWACRRSILDAMHCTCGYHQVGQVAPPEAIRRRIVVLYFRNQSHLVVRVDRAHRTGELGGKRAYFLSISACVTHVDDYTRGRKYGKFSSGLLFDSDMADENA